MAWESNLDAVTKKSIFQQKSFTPQPILDPNVSENLSNIKQRAGWVPIETQMALAKAGASNEAIDAVGKMVAQKSIDEQGDLSLDKYNRKNPLRVGYESLKTASRWLQATMDFLPETTQGAVSQAAEIAGEYGIGSYGQGTDRINNIDGWMISTKFGSLLKATQGDYDPVTGERITAGTGFFVGDELLERQAERARRYRGTINGSAFTVGRGAANTVFQAGTIPYNIFSGVIDGIILVKTDPTGPVTKSVKTYKELTELVPRLTKADAEVLREAVTFGGGFIPTLFQVGLDETKYARFMETNRRAKLLVAALRDETDVVKIFDKFDQNPNISNEMLTLLANSTTDDQVKAVLGLGFQLEKGALTDQIRSLQKTGLIGTTVKNIGGTVLEKTHLANSRFVRKGSEIATRYLTEKPEEALIINGDRFQNAKATKNIINYLRTIGADKETVSRIGKQAVEALTETGSKVDQYALINVFNKTIDEAMRLNGVNADVRKQVIQGAKDSIDQLRAYMVDRAGFSTDNGLAKFLANEYNAYIPTDQIETLIKTFGEGNDFQIISPLQIGELLKRMVVLPDVRTVRRLTSNRFFGLSDKVGTVAGMSRRATVKKIIDEDLFDKLTTKLSNLQKEASNVVAESTEEVLLATEIDDIQRQLNSLVKNVTVRVRTGTERSGIQAVDFLQNELWKPLTLMTGGYVVRNSMDAQVRMAFSGLPSVFTHPFEYIQLVLGNTKTKTLTGEALTGRKLSDYTDDIREAYTFGLRQQGLDNKQIFDHMIKTGNWQMVNRTLPNGAKLHVDAVAQNGQIVFNEPLQKIVAQTFVELGGINYDSLIIARQRVVAAIQNDPVLYKEISDLYASGLSVVDASGKATKFPQIFFDELSKDQVEKILAKHAESVPVANVATLTGNISDVEFGYAFNRIPLRDTKGNLVPTIQSTIGDLEPTDTDALRVGSTVITNKDPNEPTFGVIVRIIDAKTGARYADDMSNIRIPKFFVAEVQPIFREKTGNGVTFMTAFGENGLGTEQFRSIVENSPVLRQEEFTTLGAQKGLPAVLKREQLATERNTNEFKKTLDRSTNFFFGKLYGYATRTLERSPVFRTYYYEEIGRNVDQLSPEGAKQALEQITISAKEANKSVGTYLNNKTLVQKLNKALTGDGTATLEELDDFAKHRGLERTKELLYDASNKSNLEDAMRIVAPFAPAWKEILGTYTHLFRENPLAGYRNTTRLFNGAKNADPDNDGRGFFYKDPVTNALTFLFPASGLLARAVTGLDAPLKSPAARLSQGLQVIPALGPVAQIAASYLLPNVPATKDIVELLLPYGRKTVSKETFLPGWATKAYEALRADESKLGTVYANTYAETLLAVSTQGKYDMSDPDQVKLLQQDAKGKAKWLTGFRALSQLLGPTAGATEFKITTKDGDIYASELTKQFYALQTKDYDSAVQTFLDQFGDEVSLYVTSKSQANLKGLEATQQFGDWENANGDLFKEFPEVAAYLAPAGDDFSYAVWERQILTGKRERLSDKEMIDLAQNRIGSAKYRWARKQIGQFPDEKGRELLKQYRAVLHEELPGFPLVAEFKVGEFANNVEKMKEMVNDPRTADNKIAKTINTYIEYRDVYKKVALAQFGSDNIGQSKQTQFMRDGLANIGEMLILDNPEFARVWQRFFSFEVEE
jgi:hypothetical protein